MDRKVRAPLLAVLLIGVALVFAPCAVAIAGDTKVRLAAHTGANSVLATAVKKHDEGGISPEPPLPVDAGVHRRILANTLKNSVFEPNKPACIRTCGAAGTPYTNTGRGCESKYGCRQ